MNHTTDTAKTIRRFLHFLSMASMEAESLELDDRIKPEVRQKFKRYRQRHINWVYRDVITDMKDYRAAGEVTEEISSERAQEIKLMMDFVIQFENIGEIRSELESIYGAQTA